MSTTRARELLNKLTSDSDFRTQVAKARSAEEKKVLVVAAGYGDVSPDDIAAVAPEFNSELSDAELEAVAGGRAVDWVIGVSTVTIAIANASAA